MKFLEVFFLKSHCNNIYRVQIDRSAMLCCPDMELLGGFLKVINHLGGVNFPSSFLQLKGGSLKIS